MSAAPKIAKAQGRSVTEWIGKTIDSKPGTTVRMRVFDRYEGRDYVTKIKIEVGDDWDLDHIKRLEDGGENRESNLAPILRSRHRIKTAEETRRGKKADRSRMAHRGVKSNKAKFPQREKAERTKRPSAPGMTGIFRQIATR